MKTTAKLNHLRIAPRKVRLIADAIRNKKVEEARGILNFSIKKGSLPLLKLLNSAVSNSSLDPLNLYVSKITVDEGRKFKRWRARARGTAAKIQKKTSCINLTLEEIKPVKGAKKKTAVLKKEKSIKDKPGNRDKFPAAEKNIDRLKARNAGGLNKMFRRKSI